ncbi:hypothetical protein, partial [Mesorhizobium sp. M7A.F.Ca.MR.362.00.0.0]|uniref:hypothetical protein n=1 Tax=Mesorhizobium sp. M7A.F.Ca.MR.362.00.0.0 TaxID=2496779 RepID=UPI0034D160B7
VRAAARTGLLRRRRRHVDPRPHRHRQARSGVQIRPHPCIGDVLHDLHAPDGRLQQEGHRRQRSPLRPDLQARRGLRSFQAAGRPLPGSHDARKPGRLPRPSGKRDQAARHGDAQDAFAHRGRES